MTHFIVLDINYIFIIFEILPHFDQIYFFTIKIKILLYLVQKNEILISTFRRLINA
jgi:hypothetical protein